MNIITNPKRSIWCSLTVRPYVDNKSVHTVVKEVFENVMNYGDKSLIEYTKKFDNIELALLHHSFLSLRIAVTSVFD